MLNSFIKSFKPDTLSHTELIAQVSQALPEIIELPSSEQLMYWEFIGSKLNSEQQDVLSFGISKLFKTEDQKINYSQGIIGLSFDIAEFNQTLEELKKIKNPDTDIKNAIQSLEKLQIELQKKQIQSKAN